ncbi:hypothetical protein AK51_21990 [Serratia nematodiphila DZ0503SBS1]|nr:hypothetical protein AK51_21990 [Serratia nematodiphila DZ0503SBS1]
MPKQRVPLKLSTSITLMVSAIIASVLLVVFALFFVQMSREGQDQLQQKAIAVANTLALSNTVIDGLQRRDHSGAIQRFAEQVRHQNELLFVVVVDMQGIRYSHPKPWLIGKHFIGDDLAPALQGNVNSAINRGTLAPALRVFVPVYDDQKNKSAWWRSASRWTPCSGWWRKADGSSIGPSPSPPWSAAWAPFPGLCAQTHHAGFRALRNLQPVRTAQRHAAID